MNRDVVIAVDIGTTALKIITFNINGNIVFQRNYQYQKQIVAEMLFQDLNELVENFNILLKEVFEKITINYNVLNIVFSCAMHSFIMLDKTNKPLADIILWTDNHFELDIPISKTDFHHKTGMFYDGFLPLFKLRYIKKHYPNWWNKIGKVISIKDYLIYLMTSNFVVDYAMAGGFGCFNYHTLTWDEDILQKSEIPIDWLCSIVSPTKVLNIIGCNYSYLKGYNLVVGSADGVLANLATGYLEQNALTVTLGTSTGCRYFVQQKPEKLADNEYFLFFDQNIYIQGYTSSNGANNINWFLNEYQTSLKQMLGDVIDYERDDLNGFYFPYLVQERYYKHLNVNKFIFNSAHKTVGQLWKALIKGLIFNCIWIIENLSWKKWSSICLAGGMFSSPQLVKLFSSLVPIKMIILNTHELSAKGAGFLGFLGAKVFEDYSKVTKWQSDQEVVNKISPKMFEEYEEWLQLQKKLFTK